MAKMHLHLILSRIYMYGAYVWITLYIWNILKLAALKLVQNDIK